MGKSCLALAIFVLLSSSPAFGQYAAAIRACGQDAKKLCATVQPGGGRLAECIKSNFQSLTEPCKAALVKVAGVGESCRTDIQKQCPGLKPGAGRVLLCVKQHYAALSEPCKDAVGQAAERRVGTR